MVLIRRQKMDDKKNKASWTYFSATVFEQILMQLLSSSF